MVRPQYVQFIESQMVADAVEPLPHEWQVEGLSVRTLGSIIRRTGITWRHVSPDYALLLRISEDYSQSLYYAYWSGAHRIIAFDGAAVGSAKESTRIGTEWVISPKRSHEIDSYRELQRLLELKGDVRPVISLPRDSREHVEQLLAQISRGKAIIAICMGAGHPSRQWPVERFSKLAELLCDKESQLLFMLVGSEKDVALANEYVRLSGSVVFDASGKFSIIETACLLSKCALYVGGDTGPMHIAAALGVPVVMISKHPKGASVESPHSPVRFGPVGVPFEAVQPDPVSDQCANGCSAAAAHCICNVSADEVAAAAWRVMAKAKSDGRGQQDMNPLTGR